MKKPQRYIIGSLTFLLIAVAAYLVTGRTYNKSMMEAAQAVHVAQYELVKDTRYKKLEHLEGEKWVEKDGHRFLVNIDVARSTEASEKLIDISVRYKGWGTSGVKTWMYGRSSWGHSGTMFPVGVSHSVD